MSFCPYCGGPVDAGAAKCTYCGSPLPQQAQAPAPQANAGYTNNASAQRPNQSHSASEPVFSGASTSSSPGRVISKMPATPMRLPKIILIIFAVMTRPTFCFLINKTPCCGDFRHKTATLDGSNLQNIAKA